MLSTALGTGLVILVLIGLIGRAWQSISMSLTRTAGNIVVRDGDSVMIDGRQCRLVGIDAPEMTCSAGAIARRHLSRLVQGREITYRILGEDRYGRALVRVFAAGADLNELMVRDGYALAYTRYSRAYGRAEKTARTERRGLWAVGGISNPEADRRTSG